MKNMSLDEKVDKLSQVTQKLSQTTDKLSQEMHKGFALLRHEMREGFDDARKDRAKIRLEMKDGFDDARRDRGQIRVETKDQIEELARATKGGFDEQSGKTDRIMKVEITQLKQRVSLIEQAFALEK